jgi:hypothetical protein
MSNQATALPLTDNDEGMQVQSFETEAEAQAAFDAVASYVGQQAARFIGITEMSGIAGEADTDTSAA